MTGNEFTQNPRLSPTEIAQISDIVRVTPEFYPPDEPILGATDEQVVAPNLETLLLDPEATIAVTTIDERVAGFSIAVPIGRFDPSKEADSATTAYIYYTGIEPSLRGRGLVGPLMQQMYEELRERGYSHVERDAVLAGGWADKVEKNSQAGIVEQRDHTTWPEVGPQRHFKIDLSNLGIDKPK